MHRNNSSLFEFLGQNEEQYKDCKIQYFAVTTISGADWKANIVCGYSMRKETTTFTFAFPSPIKICIYIDV